jgi:hypothetical protein
MNRRGWSKGKLRKNCRRLLAGPNKEICHHPPVAYFFASAASWRNVAIVAAEGSLRLPVFGRRLVLLV